MSGPRPEHSDYPRTAWTFEYWCKQYDALAEVSAAQGRVAIQLIAEHDALAAELAAHKRLNADLESSDIRLRVRVRTLETDVADWKRLYDRRGLALARPCIACGHVPAVIKPASQSEPPARHCKHDDGDCHADDPCVDCPKYSSPESPAVQP